MKKLAGIFSLICVLNVLALGGVVGYLWLTGRMDKAKVQTIGDMLKHQGTPDKFREKVYDIISPAPPPPTSTMPGLAATTAPASQPAVAEGDTIEPATAEERIEFMRRTMEIERLKLEAEAQSLRDRQKLLLTKQRDIEAAVAKLADDKKVFEQQVTAAASKDDGEGFSKSMALLDTLKPKQVKDLLFGMPPAEAAKYLGTMDPDRAGKIIGEFKSTEEKAFVKALLERIAAGGKDSGTNSASGGTAAAVSAARANSPGPAAKVGP